MSAERRPLFQQGKERLNNPSLALIHVTEIHGVPGVKYDIATVRDPYHSALGGWRITTADKLLTEYDKAKNENSLHIASIMEQEGISKDALARAGILESYQLAGEMSNKWAGMRSTLRNGIDHHPDVYGEHTTELVTNRDAWLSASTMDGGTKGILVVTDPDAYANITDEQRESLMEQHGKHMIALNKRRPADAGDDVMYYTAPDMGSSEAMMNRISEYTDGKFVACYSEEKGGTGNPSPTTALGVAYGTKAVVEVLGMRQDGKNVTFAVQGAAGEVGADLVRYLRENHPNAQIAVADVDKKREKIKELEEMQGVVSVAANEIFTAGTIFVPSGPPGQLNHDTLPAMKQAGVRAVVGPANYLWTAGREEMLAEEFRSADIIVAPAPEVNQGGIRSILPQFVEQITDRKPAQTVAHKSVADVEPMTAQILEDALHRGVTPDQVFQEIAYDEYAKRCEEIGVFEHTK